MSEELPTLVPADLEEDPNSNMKEVVSVQDVCDAVEQDGCEGMLIVDASENMTDEGEVVGKIKNAVQKKDMVEKGLDGLAGVCKLEEGSTFRNEYVKALNKDNTLKEWKKLAEGKQQGFIWVGDILKKQVEDGLMGTREVIVIPKDLRQRMIRLAHDHLAHVGPKKVGQVLRENCHWPGMFKQARQYCRSCDECQKSSKAGEWRAPMGDTPLHSEPFQHIAIDLVGPFTRTKRGYKYLLTCVCLASRYPEAIPLKSISAEEVAEGLLDVFSRLGTPTTILHDQGTQFMGRLMKALCQRLGIKQLNTTPYHPQSNGCVERFHGTLLPMLRKLDHQGLEWDDQLKFALFAVRSTPNRSTGYSPFEIIYGKNLRSPLHLVLEELDPHTASKANVVEWVEDLNRRVTLVRKEVEKNELRSREERKTCFDKNAKLRKYKAGELVLTRYPGLHNKLECAWEGPYEIIDVPNDIHLILAVPGSRKQGKTGKRVHVNLCKPYVQLVGVVHRLVVAAIDDLSLDQPKVRLHGDALSPQERKQMSNVLKIWESVLSNSPGHTSVLFHDVDTGQAPPVRTPPYQLPDVWREQVKEEVAGLLEQGIIQHSTSPWSSSIVPVKKPDGKVRFCVDYRKLNKITVDDPYYIPLVEELLHKIGNSTVLSKLDLAKGFYQVSLTDAAQEKSAFTTPFGKYQFVRMPFGMKNAPSSFQRLMDTVLSGLEECSTAYIDDILIFSKNGKDHIKDVSAVLQRLQEAGLTAKPSKCVWGKAKVEYLGHIIGEGEVTIPEAKVTAIREYVRPKTQRDVRAFLGTTGYYRKFIREYAAKAKPLTASLRKSEPMKVVWTGDMETAFNALKKALCDVCALTIPSAEDKYVVHTDASYLGVGGVLSVCMDSSGQLHSTLVSSALRRRITLHRK